MVIKTILKKTTGNISLMSVDSGEGLTEKTSPFDTFAQVIDGQAELVINGYIQPIENRGVHSHTGTRTQSDRPNGRFKMILTIIKSGYE